MSLDGLSEVMLSRVYLYGVGTPFIIVALIWLVCRVKKVKDLFCIISGGFKEAFNELFVVFSSSKNTDEEILKKISDSANNFQFRLQKLIFLGLIVVLCVKGFFEILQSLGFYSQDPAELRNSNSYVAYLLEIKTLVYVASALAVSCGIQLAYMLITDGPDEAVEPLMLGIASTILLILSDSNAQHWSSDRSFAVVMLVICIPILFACSLWMKAVNNRKGNDE